MCLRVIVLLSVFVLNCGFLLEDKTPPQSSTNNQYLSVSKYLADQTSIHHDLETLRRQQEMSMNILTSQLKHKLAEMESKIPEQPSGNGTCKFLVEELEQHVQEVKQNNTRLAGDLETLQHNYNLLNNAFKNTSAELKSSLSELKHLKDIQQLQSLHNLNEKVQKIDSSVTSLRSHEQARNQDFLALYNLTIQSEAAINRKMTKYQTDLQNVDKDVNSKITELQRVSSQMKQNQTDLHNADKEMNSKITELQHVSSKMKQNQTDLHTADKEMNSKITELQRDSSKMNQFQTDMKNVDKKMNNTITEIQRNISNKVALTACVNLRKRFSSGETIKFTDIRTHIGYTDISSFQSTGQFVCPVSDLYHISVVLMSNSINHEIRIFKNNLKLVSGWIDDYYMPSSDRYFRSAAAVTSTLLDVGDTIKVTINTSTDEIEAAQTSCLTIVRIG